MQKWKKKMGMTIDEAIEFKKHGYHTPLSSFENIDDMNAQIHKYAEYDRLVLVTLRKYRKIEQALNSWNMNCINDREFINTIREVLEDGNDD